MPTQTLTGTQTAVNYVENETIRGLILVVSDVGLSLQPLYDIKETLVTAILFHLERKTLRRVQLEFRDRNGNALDNGFGVWKFNVSYDAYDQGIIEFPVKKVLDELHRNKLALAPASSYIITLWVESGSALPPGWSWSENKGNRKAHSTYVASYGWDPLGISIYRE